MTPPAAAPAPGSAFTPTSTPTPAARTLCVTVDDFGLHAGVNAAVFELLARGRVQAVSCMVGAPSWDAGHATLRQLRDQAHTADCGLHLDFTEAPLRAGSRHDLRGLIAGSLARALDADALRAEVRAQLDAFEDAMGRAPDHVDGHQHVHQLPGVREVLMAELQARYASRPPWLRCTRAPRRLALPRGERWSSALKPRIIEALGGAGLVRAARAAGMPMNAHLLGVYDFRGGPARYRALLQAWLEAARDGDVLMCHPAAAAPGDAQAAADPIGAARRTEHAVLVEAELDTTLAHAGVRLGRLAPA